MATDTWKRSGQQMGTNKATGKLGRMINIICRTFLSPLLINYPAFLTTAMLIFLFTTKLFYFILLSFKLSHISLLWVFFFLFFFLYPKSASIFHPVFSLASPSRRFLQGESKDISFASCQLLNNFLAINV